MAVSLPPAANLFLQGRDASSSLHAPRTVRPLIADVVCLAAASESIQAPFIPTGPATTSRLRAGRCSPAISGRLPSRRLRQSIVDGSLNPWPRPELGLHQRARRSRRDGSRISR